MDRFSFENKLNSYDLVSKALLEESYQVPSLNKAIVSFRLKVVSEYDNRIAHAIIFSDWFTGQRGFIKSFNFIYKFNKPMIQVIIKTTLRRKSAKEFFDFLVINYFAILEHKLVSTKVSLINNSFSFSIKDINFFYNVPNFLYNFNDMLSVQFFYKNTTQNQLKLYLSKFPEIFCYLKSKKF